MRTSALRRELEKVDHAMAAVDDATNSLQLLVRLGELRSAVNGAIDSTIVRARQTDESTWSRIGAALRLSPQAVQQRFHFLTVAHG